MRGAKLEPGARRVALFLSVALACGLGLGCENTPSVPRQAKAQSSAPSFPPEIESARHRGKELFFSPKAACSTCHKIGNQGTMIVGPNLGVGDEFEQGVAERAKLRRPELSAPAYVLESMLDPRAVVVDGYAAGVMRSPDDLPQPPSDEDLVALAIFVVTESGGTVTVEEAGSLKERVPDFRRARTERRQAAAAANRP